ncbi:MAG: DUF1778 domain-containing protein [Ignavibacteriae bacterium]|nr:DUF1778 domain-containing protein [Ignavibacteriota bacterium]
MKDTRIEFRSSPQEKDLVALAAQLAGINVSAFLREAALQAANEIIRQHEQLKLSKSDQDLFLKALDSPPEPSPRLKKSMKKYRKQRLN